MIKLQKDVEKFLKGESPIDSIQVELDNIIEGLTKLIPDEVEFYSFMNHLNLSDGLGWDLTLWTKDYNVSIDLDSEEFRVEIRENY